MGCEPMYAFKQINEKYHEKDYDGLGNMPPHRPYPNGDKLSLSAINTLA